MTARVLINEAKERLFDKFGDTISILDYSYMNADATFICNICGYQWTTQANNLFSGGHGCQKCLYKANGRKLALPYEYVYSRILELGCELLSPTYNTNSDDLDIRYPCGHINSISYANFTKRKISCRKCFLEKYYKFRYSEDDIIELLESNNLTFIEFDGEYKHGSSKVIYKCPLGHITTRDVKYVIKFPTCKKCSYSKASQGMGVFSRSWKGGVAKISGFARTRLDAWARESFAFHNGTCFVSGETKQIEIHHLYGFNMILQEALANCGLSERKSRGDYTNKETDMIADEIELLHKKYPLGLCLTKSIHKLFHYYYGRGNNTPEQFYEFCSCIDSGDIQLPT
jgi:hypothetical protein